jgi:hypothetical protein
MSTEEFIIALFNRVDDAMRDVPKHPQASLYPSELVTLALLYALKGPVPAPSIAGSCATIAPSFPPYPSAPAPFASSSSISTGRIASSPIPRCLASRTPTASSSSIPGASGAAAGSKERKG